MKRVHQISLAMFTMLLASAPMHVADALGRDSDGSRMQARPMEVGESATDRLAPPSDAIDWRYVRVSSADDVTLNVKADPAGVKVEVMITDAMGKSMTRGKTRDGNYTTRRRLEPGLYYIAVSAPRAARYSISLR